MNRDTIRYLPWLGVAALAIAPLTGMGNYPLHLLIMVLLWGFIYTGWSIMGRLGMVSFGHGAFLGIGAYVVVMGWNSYGLSPWFGLPVALALTAIVAFLIGRWTCGKKWAASACWASPSAKNTAAPAWATWRT